MKKYSGNYASKEQLLSEMDIIKRSWETAGGGRRSWAWFTSPLPALERIAATLYFPGRAPRGSASPLALGRARASFGSPTPQQGAGSSSREPLCRCCFACLEAWTFPSQIYPREMLSISQALRSSENLSALQQWGLSYLHYKAILSPLVLGLDSPHFVPTNKLPNGSICIHIFYSRRWEGKGAARPGSRRFFFQAEGSLDKEAVGCHLEKPWDLLTTLYNAEFADLKRGMAEGFLSASSVFAETICTRGVTKGGHASCSPVQCAIMMHLPETVLPSDEMFPQECCHSWLAAGVRCSDRCYYCYSMSAKCQQCTWCSSSAQTSCRFLTVGQLHFHLWKFAYLLLQALSAPRGNTQCSSVSFLQDFRYLLFFPTHSSPAPHHSEPIFFIHHISRIRPLIHVQDKTTAKLLYYKEKIFRHLSSWWKQHHQVTFASSRSIMRRVRQEEQRVLTPLTLAVCTLSSAASPVN